MIHPDTELRPAGEKIGLGVFATHPIPRGTIVWALDDLDQRFDSHRVRTLGPRYIPILERYGYMNAAGERVVCWDLARFVNHACDPNLVSCGWDFEIAVRDIAEGEEITNDYAALNVERGFDCWCRGPECRGRIEPDDFDKRADALDEVVRRAFPDVTRVPQPLWDWVRGRRLVTAAARDPRRVPSIRRHQLSVEVVVPLRPAVGRRA
jgi:hypothetical protein